jgi:hypothetical protein
MSGRRNKNMFSVSTSASNVDNNSFGYNTNSSILNRVDYIYELLYNELKDYFIEPIKKGDYDLLLENYEKSVTNIYSTSEYIFNLPFVELNEIDITDSIYEFFIKEIAKYIEIYGDSELRFYALTDIITLTEQGIFCKRDNETFLQTIDNLRVVIEDLKTKRHRGVATLEASVNVTAALDVVYLYYIQEHGPPVNGVFDAEKIGRIKNRLKA